MATTLPGNPPSYDRNDVAGTVKALSSYTRNLQENLDFMLGQIKKNQETMQQSISSQGERVATLSSAMSGVQSSLSGLGNDVNRLAARVSALEQKGTT